MVKKCFQSHVNVRKMLFTLWFSLELLLFFKTFVKDITGQKVNLKSIFTCHFYQFLRFC